MAPLALAFERIMECRILSEQTFERPVLDLGCGEGLFAKMLFVEQVDTGIDPNQHELDRARELEAYAEVIQCKGDNIPKPDGSYNTILSNSVIEHIPDIIPILNEAYRLLKPDGRMYLTVPSDKFEQYTLGSQFLSFFGMQELQKKFRRFFNRFWDHYHFYTPEGWQKIISEAGYEVEDVRSYGPQKVCLMNDFLVPFSILEFFTKKIFNRWTLFPGIRKIILSPATYIGSYILRDAELCEAGGLVFLSLRKID
ncbi:MAG: class I SAM-dependent methyltransferase [Gammaproteobacteria bacterium]|nr:class I SAM-dependent methyltransferase [Gammaproteobacteria bacterium]